MIRFRPPIAVHTVFLAKTWHALMRRYHRKQAAAELRALDDRMLKDIGIERSEIESIVHGLGRDASRMKRA